MEDLPGISSGHVEAMDPAAIALVLRRRPVKYEISCMTMALVLRHRHLAGHVAPVVNSRRPTVGPALAPEFAEWLALIQFIMVGRLDFARPGDPGHRKLLETVVLLAFLPVGVTESGV